MELRKASPADWSALQTICTEAYSANFYTHWNEKGMDHYLDKEFSRERLAQDLTNEFIDYYFIEQDGIPVGFCKLNANPDLTLLPFEKAAELEKIYILPAYRGGGIGKLAIKEIIKRVKAQGKKTLFLSVLDTNVNSIAFYKKSGFTIHSKTRLDAPNFKEELKGMHRMVLAL